MSIQAVTQENFDQTIADNEIVVVDFWASWCEPCKAFAPTYKTVANKYQNVLFASVNVEEQNQLSEDFNVRSIPLLMIIKQNIVVCMEAGALSQGVLVELVDGAVGLNMDEVRLAIEKKQK